ncbi:MAG TPA: hypothetical protein VL970_03585 [Candidatus Acidoferrales bacterium]|nr:hypothetical protein [Candidatus Acidoferrales bacterium]
MHLVIFDIDGTLTATVKTDEECFVRSLAEVYGFDDVDTDWSRYQHATGASIFRELYQARTGRPPSAAEVSRFKLHFIEVPRQASFDLPE